jgi:hypothetical protein
MQRTNKKEPSTPWLESKTLLAPAGLIRFLKLLADVGALPPREAPGTSNDSKTFKDNCFAIGLELQKLGLVSIANIQLLVKKISILGIAKCEILKVELDNVFNMLSPTVEEGGAETRKEGVEKNEILLSRQGLYLNKDVYIPIPALFNDESRDVYALCLVALQDLYDNWNTYLPSPLVYALKPFKIQSYLPYLINNYKRQLNCYDQARLQAGNDGLYTTNDIKALFDKLYSLMLGDNGFGFFQQQFDQAHYDQTIIELYEKIIAFPLLFTSVETNCQNADNYYKYADNPSFYFHQHEFLYQLLFHEYQLNQVLNVKNSCVSARKVTDLVFAKFDSALAYQFEAIVLKDLQEMEKALSSYASSILRKPDVEKINIAKHLTARFADYRSKYCKSTLGYPEALDRDGLSAMHQASLLRLIVGIHMVLTSGDKAHIDVLYSAWSHQFMSPGRLGEILDLYSDKFSAHIINYTLNLDPYFGKLCKINFDMMKTFGNQLDFRK